MCVEHGVLNWTLCVCICVCVFGCGGRHSYRGTVWKKFCPHLKLCDQPQLQLSLFLNLQISPIIQGRAVLSVCHCDWGAFKLHFAGRAALKAGESDSKRGFASLCLPGTWAQGKDGSGDGNLIRTLLMRRKEGEGSGGEIDSLTHFCHEEDDLVTQMVGPTFSSPMGLDPVVFHSLHWIHLQQRSIEFLDSFLFCLFIGICSFLQGSCSDTSTSQWSYSLEAGKTQWLSANPLFSSLELRLVSVWKRHHLKYMGLYNRIEM